jgi:hypothetical protein
MHVPFDVSFVLMSYVKELHGVISGVKPGVLSHDSTEIAIFKVVQFWKVWT